MSLLMDALRKAEQEKKEAAKRLKEKQEKTGQDLELTNNHSIDSDVSTGEIPTEIPIQEVAESGLTNKEDRKTTDNKLSLAPLDASKDQVMVPAEEMESSDSKLKDDEIVIAGGLDDKEDTIEHPAMEQTLQEEKENSGIDGIKKIKSKDLDQTFALTEQTPDDKKIKPSGKDATQEIQDEFTDTISESRISKSIISAADLVMDMGGGKDQPTPVAAQTVFTAVSSTDTKQYYRWSLFAGLCVVIALSASAFYYFWITPLTPETSSPLVAKGVEEIPHISPIEIPVLEDVPLSGEVIADESQTEKTSTQLEPGNATDESISATVIANAENISEDSGTEITAETEVTTAAGMESQAPIRTATVAMVSEEKKLPEKIEVEESLIQISRSKSIDKKRQMLNTAYKEYQAGNYNAAEMIYRTALDILPGNRDALLGLAAIAYKKGDLGLAYEKYLTILKLYPNDKIAKSALINLQSNNDPVTNESIVKVLIQEEPDHPYLYFTLGNLYAIQSRWADAQQAFFDAYRRESGNPDYAYNLAVSLDRMGLNETALDYYNVALELADQTPVSFNTSSVLSRISSLTSTRYSN